MKQYLAFAYDDHYPCGGTGDFVGAADTLAEAQAMALSPRGPGMQMDNAEVLDITTRERWVFLGEGLGWRKSYDLCAPAEWAPPDA